MKNYIVEFIGTFFLVFVIALTGDPIAIGCILTAMVYMGGHISGAHYNPAVTAAVLVRNKIRFGHAIGYILFQVGGAVLAALLYGMFTDKAFVPAPSTEMNILVPLFIETAFTFALASVVLNVATHKKTEGNSFYGLAIGLTVLAAAYAGGGISGGAYNPAVGLGPIIVDTIHGGSSLNHVWIYLVGPLTGGIAAGLIFKLINGDEA